MPIKKKPEKNYLSEDITQKIQENFEHDLSLAIYIIQETNRLTQSYTLTRGETLKDQTFISPYTYAETIALKKVIIELLKEQMSK